MKLVSLHHNPGAGDEEHSREKLVSLIEECGFKCRHSSSNHFNAQLLKEIDFIIIAGGDGTVRKFAKELLEKEISEKPPIALLPLGTANNIAKTLKIEGDTKDIINSWHKATIKKYDVGLIEDDERTLFFLESFGYGVFPYLMTEMNKHKDKDLKPDEKITKALKMLHQIILSYEPKFCKLNIDGNDYSGKYLLAEIMNTRSIGPNLLLSPDGDPGDGATEVVLVPESDKEKFASYLSKKINGEEEQFQFHTLKASQTISISWDGTHVHVDDEIIKLKKSDLIKISLNKRLLEFLI